MFFQHYNVILKNSGHQQGMKLVLSFINHCWTVWKMVKLQVTQFYTKMQKNTAILCPITARLFKEEQKNG